MASYLSQVVWLSGMSGAGKSSIATAAVLHLSDEGRRCRIVDGDDVRNHRERKLGFTREDIRENNRSIATICAQLRGDYDVIFVPVIAPYREDRNASRALLTPGFSLVHVHAPIEVLESRDTKGLYAKTVRGQINNMIGVSEGYPYEIPDDAELKLLTGEWSLDQTVHRLVRFVRGLRE